MGNNGDDIGIGPRFALQIEHIQTLQNPYLMRASAVESVSAQLFGGDVVDRSGYVVDRDGVEDDDIVVFYKNIVEVDSLHTAVDDGNPRREVVIVQQILRRIDADAVIFLQDVADTQNHHFRIVSHSGIIPHPI